MAELQEAPPPMLRFVPVDKILPHEEADQQRYTSLMKRIEASGVWLHPPLVVPLVDSEDHYVLLDGSNRCFSVGALGYPHILVQVTSYDGGFVELDKWNHVISDLVVADFLPEIHAIENLSVHETDLLSAQANLAQRNILAYMIDFATNQVYALQMADHSLHIRNSALRDLVATYKHKGKLDRINMDSADQALKLYPKATALLVFPNYEPAEIMVSARDKEPLPPGISRHIIHGRALRLNYPLSALQDEKKTLKQKNEDLADWVVEKMAQREVRYYAESVYMFDE